MNRLFAVAAVVALFGAVGASYGQCNDNYDANLCVYYEADADNQFAVDGAASTFWSTWTGKDMVEMIAPDDCYPDRCGFVGSDDAILQIKAAATGTGLYLLSTVTDNTWVDRADADDWGADAIDFFFDKDDANTIWTCTGCLIGLYDSKLTYNTQQFQIWMGASSAPTGGRYAAYDDNLWSWQTLGLTWVQLAAIYNIEIDIVTSGLGANQKAQEWFFPWVSIGKGALVPGTTLAGMKLAFSGGYNDKDGDNTNPDCLRWLGKDPWSGTANYWGDFEIQSDVPPVVGVSVKNPAAAARGIAANSGVADLYTLQGKKIAGGSLNAVKSNVVVQRSATNASVRVLGR
jgi:hypothetical protein